MIPIQDTLSEMGCLQPPSLLKNDNSTSEGVVNNTIFPTKKNICGFNFTGYAAVKLKENSDIIGTQSYSTVDTTVPNIILQLIINAMPEHNISSISPYEYIFIS